MWEGIQRGKQLRTTGKEQDLGSNILHGSEIGEVDRAQVSSKKGSTSSGKGFPCT